MSWCSSGIARVYKCTVRRARHQQVNMPGRLTCHHDATPNMPVHDNSIGPGVVRRSITKSHKAGLVVSPTNDHKASQKSALQ
jgi:hypothetical protein